MTLFGKDDKKKADAGTGEGGQEVVSGPQDKAAPPEGRVPANERHDTMPAPKTPPSTKQPDAPVNVAIVPPRREPPDLVNPERGEVSDVQPGAITNLAEFKHALENAQWQLDEELKLPSKADVMRLTLAQVRQAIAPGKADVTPEELASAEDSLKKAGFEINVEPRSGTRVTERHDAELPQPTEDGKPATAEEARGQELRNKGGRPY